MMINQQAIRNKTINGCELVAFIRLQHCQRATIILHNSLAWQSFPVQTTAFNIIGLIWHIQYLRCDQIFGSGRLLSGSDLEVRILKKFNLFFRFIFRFMKFFGRIRLKRFGSWSIRIRNTGYNNEKRLICQHDDLQAPALRGWTKGDISVVWGSI